MESWRLLCTGASSKVHGKEGRAWTTGKLESEFMREGEGRTHTAKLGNSRNMQAVQGSVELVEGWERERRAQQQETT